jgi:hypothetical protein
VNKNGIFRLPGLSYTIRIKESDMKEFTLDGDEPPEYGKKKEK